MPASEARRHGFDPDRALQNFDHVSSISIGIDRGVVWVLFRREGGQITMPLAWRNRLHRDFLIRSNENFQDEEQRSSGIAFVFESYSFFVVLKAFQSEKGEQTIWQSIDTSKDSTTYTVLFEDSAAPAGLVIAFAGVFFAHQFNNPYFDGVASIMIGIILAVVAVVLAYESKGLLVGEAVDPETLKNIRRLAESDPRVEKVKSALTMHFGPHTILLAMDLQFRKNLAATEVENSIDVLEDNIRKHHGDVKHIFMESDSISHRHQQAKSA
jgi:divalent metal cation (Fe/Co/Zn/Cd) transporter